VFGDLDLLKSFDDFHLGGFLLDALLHDGGLKLMFLLNPY
jgi:hypothetical protein